MGNENKHILAALKSIASAQEEISKKIGKHDKIIEAQGRDIAELERKVMDLRNSAIQAEVSSGVASKDVAEKYGVSPARVAQIAPRKRPN